MDKAWPSMLSGEGEPVPSLTLADGSKENREPLITCPWWPSGVGPCAREKVEPADLRSGKDSQH